MGENLDGGLRAPGDVADSIPRSTTPTRQKAQRGSLADIGLRGYAGIGVHDARCVI